MSIASILGGTVSVEDGDKAATKADQYDVSRKVRVELNFSLPEGTTEADAAAALDRVSWLAHTKVAKLLGTTALTAPTGAAEATVEPEKPKAGRGKAKPPATPAADASAIVDDPVIEGTATVVDPAADASAIVDEPAASTEVDWDAEIPAEVVEVTDADLNAAAQKKAGEGVDPTEIRKVIAGFNPDPTKVFQLRQIPAADRARFIAELGALAPKAK